MAYGPRGNNLTLTLVNSIREFFPYSPIVFSTWSGSPTTEFLGKAETIFSEDPGSGPRYSANFSTELNNINRQIRSSKAGLQAITTPYAVKLRSDLVFKNKNLLHLLKALPDTPKGPFQIFHKYVVVIDRLTFSPAKKNNFVFHVTDMMQAGLTDDLKYYWSLPEISKSEENYYDQACSQRLEEVGWHLPEFRGEQYCFRNLLKDRLGFVLSRTDLPDKDLPFRTEEVFDANLIPCRMPSLGLEIQKSDYYWTWRDSWVSSLYARTFFNWLSGAQKNGVKFRTPFPVALSEARGELLAFLYRKGFNFMAGSGRERKRDK